MPKQLKTAQAPRALTSVDPPTGLSRRGWQLWPYYISLVSEVGTLSDQDLPALQVLVATVVEVEIYDKLLAKHGAIYEAQATSGATLLKVNPAVSARADALRRLHTLFREFGLTPASRSKAEPLFDVNDETSDFF